MENKFERSGFGRFMASAAGRLIRIIAGGALIAWGAARGWPDGSILIIVGIIPLAAGLLDFCLLSPLFGGPLSGKKIRQANTSY